MSLLHAICCFVPAVSPCTAVWNSYGAADVLSCHLPFAASPLAAHESPKLTPLLLLKPTLPCLQCMRHVHTCTRVNHGCGLSDRAVVTAMAEAGRIDDAVRLFLEGTNRGLLTNLRCIFTNATVSTGPNASHLTTPTTLAGVSLIGWKPCAQHCASSGQPEQRHCSY